MGKDVVIIGAGVGGLATACLLARAGYAVTILEKNTKPGGKTGQIKADGFSFDTGPSWLLMPEVFEHFFELLGENVHSLLDLERLDPSYQIYFKDTLLSSVMIDNDFNRTKKSFDAYEPGAGHRLQEYINLAESKYQAALQSFIYRNYRSRLDIIDPKMVTAGWRFKLFQSIRSHAENYFASPELQKILLYPSLFLGTDPARLPSMYSLLNYVDMKQGVFYPSGGMYRLVEELVRIAESSGVSIRYNQPVTGITVRDGKSTGVKTEEFEYHADIVISNTDRHHSETLLAPNYRAYSERSWKRKTVGPSALLIYLGVKGSYPNLVHHNLVFSKDWGTNFEAIFRSKKLPADPSFYVSNPSKTDHSAAPKGHENLFILVPIAATMDYGQEQIESLADGVLATMEDVLHLKSFQQNIVYKKIFWAKDFATQFNSFKGSALGMSHNLFQTGPFRAKNYHPKVSNLYFVGADTTPGIGLPMCLISAELVYKQLAGLVGDGPVGGIKKLV